MKGIILAGGSGTRLYPITKGISKQLVPIYNKPMIYYPLSVLMLAGIKDILIITTPEDQQSFKQLLGDGSFAGINLQYAVQARPDGLAQAFIIGRDFVGKDSVALILGDNIYYGHGLTEQLSAGVNSESGATVYAYHVQDPQRYGVVAFDANGKANKIVEKPAEFVSPWAVTGLYFYDNQVLDIAANLKPSARGELEITDVNKTYLERGQLKVEKLGRGIAWLDTGTYESLIQASVFVQTIESRQGQMVCCPEEIAFHQGWIDLKKLSAQAESMKKNQYGEYLQQLVNEAK